MIHKTFVQVEGRKVARVSFILPHSLWADRICLVGDFNNWNPDAHPFQRNPEGDWVLTIDLEPGQSHQFRYLRDGSIWMNESAADAHVPNDRGSENSVVIT